MKCPYCKHDDLNKFGKKFGRIKEDIMVHERVQRYQCQQCGKSTTNPIIEEEGNTKL